MSSESTLILLGILVVITPYSGVPTFWYAYILPTLGIIIIGIGFLFRSRRVSHENNPTQTSSEQSLHTQSSDDTPQQQDSGAHGNDETSAELSASSSPAVTQKMSSTDTSDVIDTSDTIPQEPKGPSPIS